MRWRRPERVALPLAMVAALAVGVRADSRGAGTGELVAARIDARLTAVGKTEALLDDKLASQQSQVRARLRAAYKLARSGDAPLWLDPDARRRAVVWRGAAARILARELGDLDLLMRERAVATRARQRLEQQRGAGPVPPPPGGLVRPVPGQVAAAFGSYRHRQSRATLVRRGVELVARPGEPVAAVAPGEVVYSGSVRGLGSAIIVDHGDYLSVIGGIGAVEVVAGDVVEPGQPLAEAANRRIYLEIRLDAGAGGEPVDPAPLLAR